MHLNRFWWFFFSALSDDNFGKSLNRQLFSPKQWWCGWQKKEKVQPENPQRTQKSCDIEWETKVHRNNSVCENLIALLFTLCLHENQIIHHHILLCRVRKICFSIRFFFLLNFCLSIAFFWIKKLRVWSSTIVDETYNRVLCFYQLRNVFLEHVLSARLGLLCQLCPWIIFLEHDKCAASNQMLLLFFLALKQFQVKLANIFQILQNQIYRFNLCTDN